MSRVSRKPVIMFSNQVQHKPGCTFKPDGYKLENWDLGREMYILCSENKDTDQLYNYCAADPRHCFRMCNKLVSS